MALCALCQKKIFFLRLNIPFLSNFFITLLLTYEKSWSQLMAYQKIGAKKHITGFPHYPKLEMPMKILVS